MISTAFAAFIIEIVVVTGSPEFIVHPVSINTTDGTTVEFTCIASNLNILVFMVNETQVSNSVEEKGFMELATKNLPDGKKKGRLKVIASVMKNSNSRIQCRAYDGSSIVIAINNGMEGISNTATLLVQGPLSSVVDLSYSFIDSSTVNISWSPPFTLLGTDIAGYNISATSNGTTTNYFTSDSYYLLMLTDISCKINVTVSGYNGLEGKHYSFYVPSVKPTAPLVMMDVLANLSVYLFITVNNSCTDNYSVVNISLLRGNELIDSKLETSLDSMETLLSNIFQLIEDLNYTIIGFYTNTIFGTEVVINEMFDTYGIESVTITHVVDGIVSIICQFNSFSTDTGCTVQLVLQDTSTVQYTATFNRIGSIAEGNISILSGRIYDILAFDEGSTVVAASLLGVSRNGSTTITSTDSTTSITGSSTTIIIGISDHSTTTTITSTPMTFISTSNIAIPSKSSKPVASHVQLFVIIGSSFVGLALFFISLLLIAIVSVISIRIRAMSKDKNEQTNQFVVPVAVQTSPMFIKETENDHKNSTTNNEGPESGTPL